jgi:propionyl-CoA carboxylase alpha chain
VRADLGVACGSEIGIHYDSMLGKIIAHAPARRDAAQLLRSALERTWVPGLTTNREQLARILGHPAFLAGELDTHFLERHAGELAARPPGLDRIRVAAVAATLHGVAARRGPDELTPPGWRNVRFADQSIGYQLGESDVLVGYRPVGSEIELAIGGKPTRVSRFGVDGDRVWFVEHRGHRRTARVARAGARISVLSEGQLFVLVEQPRFAEPGIEAVAGGLTAPMPGKVVRILVTAGQEVAAGAALVVLEAMKMEHTVRAMAAGTVRAIQVAVGEQVDGGCVLAVVTE